MRLIPASGVRIPPSPPFAPVAQLDRVPGYEPGGQRFESSRAHHTDSLDISRGCFFMGAILPVLGSCGPDGDRCAAVLNDTCYSRHITPCLRPIFPLSGTRPSHSASCHPSPMPPPAAHSAATGSLAPLGRHEPRLWTLNALVADSSLWRAIKKDAAASFLVFVERVSSSAICECGWHRRTGCVCPQS